MKKIFKAIIKGIKTVATTIAYPFIAFSVIVDETRRENLDGRYDKYWERKNRKERAKNAKRI